MVVLRGRSDESTGTSALTLLSAFFLPSGVQHEAILGWKFVFFGPFERGHATRTNTLWKTSSVTYRWLDDYMILWLWHGFRLLRQASTSNTTGPSVHNYPQFIQTRISARAEHVRPDYSSDSRVVARTLSDSEKAGKDPGNRDVHGSTFCSLVCYIIRCWLLLAHSLTYLLGLSVQWSYHTVQT